MLAFGSLEDAGQHLAHALAEVAAEKGVHERIEGGIEVGGEKSERREDGVEIGVALVRIRTVGDEQEISSVISYYI